MFHFAKMEIQVSISFIADSSIVFSRISRDFFKSFAMNFFSKDSRTVPNKKFIYSISLFGDITRIKKKSTILKMSRILTFHNNDTKKLLNW